MLSVVALLQKFSDNQITKFGRNHAGMDVVLGLDYYLDYFLRYCIYVHCDLCEV